MQKKLLFIISLFIFSNITFLLSAEIIPLKKPAQTKEEKEQKLLIDVLKPLPKPIINKIISENEGPASEYRSGKEAALKFLLGQGMKKTKGSADPKVLEEMLKEALK